MLVSRLLLIVLLGGVGSFLVLNSFDDRIFFFFSGSIFIFFAFSLVVSDGFKAARNQVPKDFVHFFADRNGILARPIVDGHQQQYCWRSLSKIAVAKRFSKNMWMGKQTVRRVLLIEFKNAARIEDSFVPKAKLKHQISAQGSTILLLRYPSGADSTITQFLMKIAPPGVQIMKCAHVCFDYKAKVDRFS